MFPFEAIAAPLVKMVGDVMNRVLPREKMSEKDFETLQHELELEVIKHDWEGVAAQLAVNQEEAKHESIFVAGWRPAVGWVCASAFAYHFVAQPFAIFWIAANGIQLPPLPVLDAGTLMPVLMGMLGLGGMRSFEKFQKANKRR